MSKKKKKNPEFKFSLKEEKILSQFGFSKKSFMPVNNIRQLTSSVPKMVVVNCNLEGGIKVDNSETIKINKGDVYVMNYGVYEKMNSSSPGSATPYKHTFHKFFRRYKNQNLNGKKLLFFRTGGVGDLIFTQPCIKYLKSKYDCEIHYSTAPNNLPLFDTWEDGLLDGKTSMPFSLEYFNQFDYHACFQGAIEGCEESQRVDAYNIFRKVLSLDFDIKDYAPTLHPDEEIVNGFKNVIDKPFVLLHIKSTSPLRNMRADKWITIIDRMLKAGYNVAFIDKSASCDYYDNIIDKFNMDKTRVFNVSKYCDNLKNAINIASMSDGVIAVDSSMGHICGALGKPVVGLFGAFLGELRLPFYKYSDWINTSDTFNECGHCPCFFHSHQIYSCPYMKETLIPKCLDQINEDEVVTKFTNLYTRYKNDVKS